MHRIRQTAAVALFVLLSVASSAQAYKAPAGDQVTVASGGASSPDVVYNGADDQYLVVWGSAGTLYGRVLHHDLSPAGGAFGVSDPGRGGTPSAAYDADRDEYLVVWPGP